jgi:phosphate transport system substrate-binding protein
MNFGLKSSHVASSMSIVAAALGLAFAPATTQKSLAQTAINGAGATFPDRLYRGDGGWFQTYGAPSPAVNPNVTFNYAAVGSGAGINAFLTQVEPSGLPSPIAFGASDAPLRLSSSTPVPTVTGSPNKGPAIQVPVVAGAVAIPYNRTNLNIPSAGLRLSRSTYVGIFNGNITNWNDSRITADNGRKLTSNLPIQVVRRADSSGTTFLLSNHIETVDDSTPFNWTRGVGTTVNWPSSFLSASGSSGVAARVASTTGAIGYVEQAFTTSPTRLSTAALQNQAGGYVAPSVSAVTTALTGATDQDSDPRIITILVPNPTASGSYPIVGVTYQLYYDDYASSAVAAGIRGFIGWAEGTSQADSIATSRFYAPLPSSLKTTVRNLVNTYVDTDPN